MDGSGGVWGNRGLERELAGFPFPTAADYAVKGPVPRLDVAQVPHGARAQDDVLEAGLCRVVVNARERLKHPRDEVAPLALDCESPNPLQQLVERGAAGC